MQVESGGPGAAAVARRADSAQAPWQLHVEMKPVVVVGSPTVVRVRLGRGHATSDGPVDDRGGVDLDPLREIEVALAPRGFRFAAGARRVRHLRLPSGRGEVEAGFRIIGVAPGPGEVSVVLRQHAELPVATLRLTAQVVNADGSGLTGLARQSAGVAAPPAQLAALPTIRVDEELAGTRSTLHMAVAVGGRSHRFTTRLRDKPAYVARIHARIAEVRQELASVPPADRSEAGRRRMRQIGTTLFQDLFDARARELLWEHRDELDGLVVQTTGELDLPWEIVHVTATGAAGASPAGEPRFLAEFGLTRWVYDTAHPISIPIRPGRAHSIRPVYGVPWEAARLPGADGGGIRSPFVARADAPADARALRRVVSGGFDLLHLTGHVRWAPADARRQELLLGTSDPAGPTNGWGDEWDAEWGNDASYTDDDARRDLPDHPIPEAAGGPLVLFDAFHPGDRPAGGVGLGGFTEAFLRGGAGALVIRSWSVADESTDRFARAFSDALLAGGTIAEATRGAREAARAGGDLSDLAFAVYGHPFARVRLG